MTGTVWRDGEQIGTVVRFDATIDRSAVPVWFPRQPWWQRLLRRKSVWRDSAVTRTGTMQLVADPLWQREILQWMGLDPGPVGPLWARALGRTVAWWFVLRCVWR